MINTLQINNIKEVVKLNKLQQGIEPSNKDIINDLNAKLYGHAPGEPYFSPLDIEPHSVTNTSELNNAYRNLAEDLRCLFQANVILNKQLIDQEEKSNVEKNLIDSQLNKIFMKFDNIQRILETNSYIQNKIESFKDFKAIDMSSTASINLKEHNVTLNKMNTSKRYDISNSDINLNIISPYFNKDMFGDLNTILKDTYNEYAIYKFETKENSEFILELIVTLDKPININTISLDINSTVDINSILYVSSNGTNYIETYNVTGNKKLEWNFEETYAKVFKIIITKKEADGYNEGLYEHYFILKNIAAYKNVYSNEAILLSKPFKFYGSVDKLFINVNDVIFNETNIIYSLGIENTDGHTHWNVTENNETLDLNILASNSKILNRTESNYGDDAGDGCYKIFELPKDTNINSIELFPGYQMWYHEVLSGIGGYNYTLELNSYDSSKITSKDFIDTEDYKLSIKSQELHVFTQYVYCSTEQIISFDKADVPAELSDKFQQIIFCNGTKIINKNNSYTLSLKKGKNKILMFVYLGTDKNHLSYIGDVALKVNFKTITDDIYAFPKMKYVNPYTLKNENLSENYIYFSVENNYIIVKHKPNELLSNYNNELRYYIAYKYLTDKSQYLHFNNNKPYIKIKLKALLLSSNKNFSPQILNYQISSE